MESQISLSPLQVKQLLFTKVAIEPYNFSDDQQIWAPTFDFKGVSIKTDLMTAMKDGEEDNPQNFLVSVRIAIPNDSDTDGKIAPYTIEVEAQALIELEPVFGIEERHSIVSVNGSTVVIGAIRELVTQLTARSVYGPMTLPTLRLQTEQHEA